MSAKFIVCGACKWFLVVGWFLEAAKKITKCQCTSARAYFCTGKCMLFRHVHGHVHGQVRVRMKVHGKVHGQVHVHVKVQSRLVQSRLALSVP